MTVVILKVIGYLGLLGFVTIAFGGSDSVVIPWVILFLLMSAAVLDVIGRRILW